MPVTINTSDPESQKYLMKIGEIMVKFSLLEQVIELWVWELIDANGLAAKKQSIGSSVTMHLEYDEKLELLRSLVIERGNHLFSATQFSPIINRLRDNDKNRTRITHSMWFLGSKRRASV